MDVKPVMLGMFGTLHHATLARNALDAEGIPATIEGVYSEYDPIRVWIHPDDMTRAMAVLDEMGATVQDRLARGDPIRCLDCDSESLEIVRMPPKRFLARLFYPYLNKAKLRCRDCEYEWLSRLW